MAVEGKVALITGGASGIGLEVARHLLRAGAKGVAILDVAEQAGKAAASDLEKSFGAGRARFFHADLAKADQFEEAFHQSAKAFGGLDIVVNNAGILNEDKWELTVAINVTAVIRGTLLALELMGRDRGGRGGTVLNVASIFGLATIAGAPVYVATKHAVIGLTRSFGMSFHQRRTGVRVLALCPGITDTPLVRGANLSSVDEKTAEELAALPQQKADALGQAAVQILQDGESGSLWVAEGGKRAYQVRIPEREDMRV